MAIKSRKLTVFSIAIIIVPLALLIRILLPSVAECSANIFKMGKKETRTHFFISSTLFGSATPDAYTAFPFIGVLEEVEGWLGENERSSAPRLGVSVICTIRPISCPGRSPMRAVATKNQRARTWRRAKVSRPRVDATDARGGGTTQRSGKRVGVATTNGAGSARRTRTNEADRPGCILVSRRFFFSKGEPYIQRGF